MCRARFAKPHQAQRRMKRAPLGAWSAAADLVHTLSELVDQYAATTDVAAELPAAKMVRKTHAKMQQAAGALLVPSDPQIQDI